MEFRVGQGIDIHPFVSGRKLILGGVEIPSDRGLDGHSDADALLHAITDALLGAAGHDDIGTFFPNDDSKFKDAASSQFVRDVWVMLKNEGWSVQNIDCTLLMEAPKVKPYVGPMKEAISGLLEIAPDRVSIKATTAEKLGFIGRGEGVYASAVVLISRA